MSRSEQAVLKFLGAYPPTPAKELPSEFWRLEKEVEEMLKGLAE